MSQQTSGQRWEQEVLAADGDFFTALVVGDAPALDGVLADGFVLVGVNDGAMVPRATLLPLVGRGQIRCVERHTQPVTRGIAWGSRAPASCSEDPRAPSRPRRSSCATRLSPSSS